MRHLACLLLIGLLFVQRTALPHSHAGSAVVEPGGHDLRPHIHLTHDGHERYAGRRDGRAHAHRGVDQRDDRGGDRIAGWRHALISDHDRDAVYLNVGGTTGLVGPLVRDVRGPQYNPLLLASLSDVTEHRPVCLHFADPFTSLPAVAAPLCDIARHERSGVQLI